MPDSGQFCASCGQNTWQAKWDREAVERLNAQINMLKKELLMAQSEILRYKLHELDQIGKQSWLDRKVKSQAKRIRHLEDKLRKARVQPYEGLERLP